MKIWQKIFNHTKFLQFLSGGNLISNNRRYTLTIYNNWRPWKNVVAATVNIRRKLWNLKSRLIIRAFVFRLVFLKLTLNLGVRLEFRLWGGLGWYFRFMDFGRIASCNLRSARNNVSRAKAFLKGFRRPIPIYSNFHS